MTAPPPRVPGLVLNFDNSYARLGEPFGIRTAPRPLPDPVLVHVNDDVVRTLDLAPDTRHRDALRDLTAGARIPHGTDPVAMLYAGHQFGALVPTLGDGRALLLGEVVNNRGERWDLHLKGSGQTPFSRGFDGRSVLRSAIREYLGSEALHALGVPTTRALALVVSSEPVRREAVERAASIIRVAPSHVRFGSFEAFHYAVDVPRLAQLADYVIELHFPALAGRPDRHARLLEAAARRTAQLVAAWQAVGFVHGVMNTDNFSILGLTLDYGPFAFLEGFDPDFTPNHTDVDGRYAFGQQPAIGQWNVSALATAMLPLMTREEALAALDTYLPAYESAYAEHMRAKLGLQAEEDADAILLDELQSMMAGSHCSPTSQPACAPCPPPVDWTTAWRALGGVTRDGRDARAFESLFPDRSRCQAWLAAWRARLVREGSIDAARQRRMDQANPRYILRTWLAHRAITAAEEADYGPLAELFDVLTRPFDDQVGRDEYALPAPEWARGIELSCSS